MVALFQAEIAENSRKVLLDSRKSCGVSQSDSSPLSVLDFLALDSPSPGPDCASPLTSPKYTVSDASPSPVLLQSPLLASQKLFARLSSTNFRTPGRGTSGSIPPKAAQRACAPSPQRQKGARARFKGRSFGRSSSLNENKVLLGPPKTLHFVRCSAKDIICMRSAIAGSSGNTASPHTKLGMSRPVSF